jgi:hypothetical protein
MNTLFGLVPDSIITLPEIRHDPQELVHWAIEGGKIGFGWKPLHLLVFMLNGCFIFLYFSLITA